MSPSLGILTAPVQEIVTLCALYFVAAGLLVRLALFLRGWRARRNNVRRGWRLRRVVPGRWVYEEKRGCQWVGILFEEPWDNPESPNTVVAPSPDTWLTFPAWAQGRRLEILERVQSELKTRHFVLRVQGPTPGAFDSAVSPR
jgi:hypothetical protein